MKEKLLREPEGHATRPSAGVKRAAPVEKPVKSFKERGQDLKEKETEKEKTEEKTGFFSRTMNKLGELMRAEYTKVAAGFGLLYTAVGAWGVGLSVNSLAQGVTTWYSTDPAQPDVNVPYMYGMSGMFLVAGVVMLTFAALSWLNERKLRRAEEASAPKVEEAAAAKKGMLDRLASAIDSFWEKYDGLIENTGMAVSFTGVGMLGVGCAFMLLPVVPVITSTLIMAGVTMAVIGMLAGIMVAKVPGGAPLERYEIHVKREKPQEKE